MGYGPETSRRRLAAGALAATLLAVVPAAALAATPDSWRVGPDAVVRQALPTTVKLDDGRIMLVGGNSLAAPVGVQVYSPATDAFARVASLSSQRLGPLAVTLADGQVLVAGSASLLDTSAEVYDPDADAWTPTANDMRAYRERAPFFPEEGTATALPDGGALLAGGVTAGPVPAIAAEVDRYEPADNAFHPAADMTTPRFGPGAASLPGGRVLVVGGADDTHALATGEVYDPTSNTWTPVANEMSAPQVWPTVVALPDGRVLVFGGTSSTTVPLEHTTDSELYDPATNRFAPTGPMLEGVVDPSAAALGDGRVVAAGGYHVFGGPSGVSSITQVYEPSVRGWVAGADTPEDSVGGAATLPGGEVFTPVPAAGVAAPGGAQIYTPAAVPDAPGRVTAQAGDRIADVAWSAPAANGRPITGYTVRASSGAVVSTPDARTHATIGVPDGAPVSFTVTASNDVGAGPASAPSAAVTPRAPAAPTPPDRSAPTLRISKLHRTLRLRTFLRGVTATVTPSEPASLSVDLLASARRATIARVYTVVLASKTYRRSGSRRTITIRPSRKLVGHSARFKVRVRFEAVDAAGNRRTVARTIRVAR